VQPDNPVPPSLLVVGVRPSDLSFEWVLAGGKIESGQGTESIVFLVNDDNQGVDVKVTVTIKGLPEECESKISGVFPIARPPEGDPVNRFGQISANEIWANVDNLLIQLASNSKVEGLIVIQFNALDSVKYRRNRLELIKKHLLFRKVDLTTLKYVIGEAEGGEETTLWVMPYGAKLPKSVNSKYKLIPAENLSKEISTIFSKNNNP
jgi:hypothetical protein